MDFNKKHISSLYLLLGIFVWFPGFAVFNFENIGIQVVQVLLILLFISFLLEGSFVIPHFFLFIILIWVFTILITTFFSTDISQSLISLIPNFSVLFAMFVAGGFVTREVKLNRGLFLKGYLWGGGLSAIFSFFQLAFLEDNWDLANLLSNNATYDLPKEQLSIGELSDSGLLGGAIRPFGFTPEPSVLSSLLIPGIIYLAILLIYSPRRTAIHKNPHFYLLIIFVLSLIASTSFAIVTIPVIIFFLGFFVPNTRIYYKRLFGSFLLFLPFIIYLFWNEETFVSKRLSTLTEDGSFTIRLTSIITATTIFLQYPLFGYGPGAVKNRFLEIFELLNLEEKKGPDSLPFSIASQMGLLGLAALGITWGAIIKRFLKNKSCPPEEIAFKGFIISILVAFIFQTSDPMLYHYPIGIGMALIYGYKIKKRVAQPLALIKSKGFKIKHEY